jgi:hypothetical protein
MFYEWVHMRSLKILIQETENGGYIIKAGGWFEERHILVAETVENLKKRVEKLIEDFGKECFAEDSKK